MRFILFFKLILEMYFVGFLYLIYLGRKNSKHDKETKYFMISSKYAIFSLETSKLLIHLT